jgi:hypothetical protein
MTSTRTVIFMCGDYRLRDRVDELFMFYRRLDGCPPFSSVGAGASLPYKSHEVLNDFLLPYLDKGATHIHIEDHLGCDPNVPGCAAYALAHKKRLGSQVQYRPMAEEQDHINQLDQTAKLFINFAESNGFEVTINTGLYRHDAQGFGTLTPLRSDRLVPTPFASPANLQMARR